MTAWQYSASTRTPQRYRRSGSHPTWGSAPGISSSRRTAGTLSWPARTVITSRPTGSTTKPARSSSCTLRSRPPPCAWSWPEARAAGRPGQAPGAITPETGSTGTPKQREKRGLAHADVDMIRNFGTVIDDDAVRSLVLSTRLLGTKEIMIINHTRYPHQGIRVRRHHRAAERGAP